MLGTRTSRIRVVSGGGSAAARLGCQPRSPAAPASVIPRRNLRRLNRLGYTVCMGTSFPDGGQCDTENADPWMLCCAQSAVPAWRALGLPLAHIFSSRSSGGSAWSDLGRTTTPAAPARAAPARNRRRVCVICCIGTLPFRIAKGNSGRNRAKEVSTEAGGLVGATSGVDASAQSGAGVLRSQSPAHLLATDDMSRYAQFASAASPKLARASCPRTAAHFWATCIC